MSDPLHPEPTVQDLQNQLWSRHMCDLAIAVRKMWIVIGEALGIDDNAVHALTNLAKASSDNTLSVSELAQASDLTIERATEAIDALIARNLAVRALPRPGEELKDRRVQLPVDHVGMVFAFYRLQPQHREALARFTAEDLKFFMEFMEVATSIAHGQADAINTRQINPAPRFTALRGGTA